MLPGAFPTELEISSVSIFNAALLREPEGAGDGEDCSNSTCTEGPCLTAFS